MQPTVRPGHACAVPVSDEHLWELTADFLAEGLAAGEHVIYGENDTAHAVLSRLADDGVPVRRHLDAGRLVLLPAATMPTMATASAATVLEAVDGMLTAALERFPAVRLLGEASAGMRHAGGTEMLEYEARFDEIVEGRAARIGCLYDRNRYSTADIGRLRALHRHQLDLPSPLYDDDLVRITVPRPFVARVAGEVDHSNRPRIRIALQSALDAALRAPESPEEIEVDLASLRFLDVAAATTLVHAARDFPPPHRLLLTGARPGVLRVLDRCGAPFAERLRVLPHPGPWTDAEPAGSTS